MRTTAISLAAIIYLFSSGIPHYKWLGVTLIGWCGMQFAEMLLWLTNPMQGCTSMNTLITLTMVPAALVMQPLGSLFGSLYVIPWSESSPFRKLFIVGFTVAMLLLVGFGQFYNPDKLCTTVSPNGHLYWSTRTFTTHMKLDDMILYYTWAFLVIVPFLLFWNKNSISIVLLSSALLLGFFYGDLYTDSRASIWCYYTSYTSIIASLFLAMRQAGIYQIL